MPVRLGGYGNRTKLARTPQEIVHSRDTRPQEKCSACEGTGKRLLPDLMTWRQYVVRDCVPCGGSGKVPQRVANRWTRDHKVAAYAEAESENEEVIE